MCGVPNLTSSSSKYPIAYIEILFFSHATEDLSKVETAVRNTLPEAVSQDLTFKKTNCVGHHGNPIVMVETKLSDRTVLLSALEKIGNLLSTLDKEQLDAELKQHIEKHNLFLRLDKQSAFLGTLKLTSNDPIHFKIHFKNRASDEITEICRQAGLLP
jgi:RNA binding exosome subunit